MYVHFYTRPPPSCYVTFNAAAVSQYASTFVIDPAFHYLSRSSKTAALMSIVVNRVFIMSLVQKQNLRNHLFVCKQNIEYLVGLPKHHKSAFRKSHLGLLRVPRVKAWFWQAKHVCGSVQFGSVRFTLVACAVKITFGSLWFYMASVRSVDIINFENKYDYPDNYELQQHRRSSVAV